MRLAAVLGSLSLLFFPTSHAAPAASDAAPLLGRALGINCRGSGLCGGGHLSELVDASALIDQDKIYHNGDHILCHVYAHPVPWRDESPNWPQ